MACQEREDTKAPSQPSAPVAVVTTPDGGRIGMTGCPNPSSGNSLVDLRGSGATCLVTVAEAHEIKSQQANNLGDQAKALFGRHGWLHTPVLAEEIPDDLWEIYWSRLAPVLLHNRLAAGELVIVQGLQGYGRTGLVTCRLLVESGVPPEDALAIVRQAKPGAVNGPEQQAYVLGLLDHQSVVDQINTRPEVANRLAARLRGQRL